MPRSRRQMPSSWYLQTVIPRTDKGSIARKEVYKLFKEQIAQVYQTLETRSIDSLVKLLDAENLEQGLIDLIDLTFSEQKPSIAYHFEKQSWSVSLITLGSQLGICQFSSFEDWLNQIVKSDSKCGPRQNPALQLEVFFREDFRRIACGLWSS